LSPYNLSCISRIEKADIEGGFLVFVALKFGSERKPKNTKTSGLDG